MKALAALLVAAGFLIAAAQPQQASDPEVIKRLDDIKASLEATRELQLIDVHGRMFRHLITQGCRAPGALLSSCSERETEHSLKSAQRATEKAREGNAESLRKVREEIAALKAKSPLASGDKLTLSLLEAQEKVLAQSVEQK